VGRLPLATIVHNLCFRHSRRFNTKHGHTGHLFERRYRAVLVETELELLRLVRYIHLNPVRAGMVRSAAAYPWGSHCCYYGAGRFSWLCTRRVLELLARRGTDAQALLSAYVDTPGEAEAAALVGAGNRLLLDSRPPPDAARVAPALRLRQITLTEVLDSVCRAAGCDLAALAAPFQTRALVRARGVAALVVRRAPHLSLRELGDQLHRDGSSLGRAAESVSRSAPRSPEVRSLLERVASALHLPPLL
jgi:hypothetical protein